MKRISVPLAILVAGSASACYNDRDTLGFELRDRPDAQRALTGRFERNPPLYYEMRVARLRAQPRLTTAEHDDLAVALDRLGRSEEALAALDPRVLQTPDDRYRFSANRGTIRAHRWIRRGARASEIHELWVVEHDLVDALAINPNAHFGREAVQLELIRWLDRSAPKPEERDETLGSWLRRRVQGVDPVVGLEGLIELGGAWESPDVALAVAVLEDDPKTFSIEEMAYERYRELRHEGRPTLSRMTADEAENQGLELGMTPPAGEPTVAESFHRLRAEAEAWNRSRTAFMLARLKAGRHPDTDPTFWNGWRDAPMPRLDPSHRLKHTDLQYRWFIAFAVGILLGIIALSVLAVKFVGRWLPW